MSPVTPHPSATVVLMRDGETGVEILMVRRSEGLSFHGGAWVFPGGRIDPEDRDRAKDGGLLEAARHAAVREAGEEAGIVVEADALVPFAEWVTPEILPKRFRTWFFAARGDEGSGIRVDGGEVVDHSWVTADAALALHRDGQLDLPHPTWVTLSTIRAHGNVNAVLAALSGGGMSVFHPRMRAIEGGTVSLFEGDVAYDGGELDSPGPRHRHYAGKGDWTYERSD